MPASGARLVSSMSTPKRGMPASMRANSSACQPHARPPSAFSAMLSLSVTAVGDVEFSGPLRYRRAVTRLEVEQDFVFEYVNVQVALHLALGVDQRGVTAFADFQILHVVGDLAVEKLLSVRASEAKARAK